MHVYTDSNGCVLIATELVLNPKTGLPNLYEFAHGGTVTHLKFQNGSPKEMGVNGVSNEAVIAAVLHHLKGQDKAVPSRESKKAIEHLTKALDLLESRVVKRIERGVNGTLER